MDLLEAFGQMLERFGAEQTAELLALTEQAALTAGSGPTRKALRDVIDLANAIRIQKEAEAGG